ncbi:unnamed protein product [Phytomonas sp. EM1]|nr:unnamed protein product [Phytomonas sp. EM1]|eukprot:CCW64274.1 unnamed protein product [Phytomonas sp. isolate EM1]
MSIEIANRDIDIDLSKLINFSLTFNPLQLALQEILQRLKALEDQNEEKSDELARLRSELDELRDRQQKEQETESLPGDGRTEISESAGRDGDLAKPEDLKNEGDRPCTASDHDALWAEIDLLKSLLGELTENTEKDRHSIDELYALRKRRDSYVQPPHFEPPSKLRDSLCEDRQEERPGSSILRYGGPSSCSRPESGFYSQEGNSGSLSMGDKVLRKAHEELPELTKGKHSFTGERTSIIEARPEPGEDMQPSHRLAQPSTDDMRPFPGQGSPIQLTSQKMSKFDMIPPALLESAIQSRGHSASTTAARDDRSSRSALHDIRPSITISDQLKRDSHDIAYLNRVVAEILGEMKGLHDDVDLLQMTYQGKRGEDEFSEVPHSADATLEPGQRLLDEPYKNLKRRVEALHKDSLQRSEALQNQIDDLRKGMKVAQQIQDSDLDHARGVPGLKNRLGELENRLFALEQAADRADGKLSEVLNFAKEGDGSGDGVGGISGVQFALLQGAVRALEKQLAELQGREPGKDWGDDLAQLEAALRRLHEQLAALELETQRNARECVRLEKVKADRDGEAAEIADNLRAQSASLDGLLRRLKALEDGKAGADDLALLRDHLNERLSLLDQGAAQVEGRGAPSVAAPGAGEGERIHRLQQELADQIAHSGGGTVATQDDLEALRELVDRLDRCKADSTLVANKAERDYVENALERLMREVEQVLNATNAGLIDTLDRSLGILRDMIDSKASKQDVTRLQESVGDGSVVGKGAADVLTGFKGYRCLGCNRVVESLRPRTLGSKMNPFLNRTPQHLPKDGVTRSIEYEHEQRERTDGGGGRPGVNSAPPLPSPNEYDEAVGSPVDGVNRALPRIGAPSSR